MDPAIPPTHPKVGPGTVLAIGALLSVLLALGTAVLLELRDPILGNANQLEAELGAPPLGSVIKIA
jgi:capsular polysaccharide biosynthesis protein